MQEVILSFFPTGYKDYYQVKLRIFDNNRELIFEGKTFNGKIKLCLLKKKTYLLEATLGSNQLIVPFYVTNYHYVILFNNDNIDTITFLLTDYHYDNLPIMKGVLSFDKNN